MLYREYGRKVIVIIDEYDVPLQKAVIAKEPYYDEMLNIIRILSGNIFKKAKSMVPVLVPLFISAFRRANDLAMAMEARCYHGGEGRTQMKPLRYAGRDYAAYAVLLLYLAMVIVIGKNIIHFGF